MNLTAFNILVVIALLCFVIGLIVSALSKPGGLILCGLGGVFLSIAVLVGKT